MALKEGAVTMDLVSKQEVINILCKDCCNDEKGWCEKGNECEAVEKIRRLQNPLADDGK